MVLLVMAFGLGLVAGMRAMMPLMMVSWAARFNVLHLAGTPLAFMGYMWSPWIFSLLAVGELISDKLPTTPSRKIPPAFVARIVTGGFSGAALGVAGGSLALGLGGGVIGAVAGTLGGAWARGKLAGVFGKDLPAALCEDIAAIVLGLVTTGLLREF